MTGVTDGVRAWGDRLERATAQWGIPVGRDWPALLGERAAFRGFSAPGRTSCGGSARLLPSADGWAAVSLARPSDVELVGAWHGVLGRSTPADAEPWQAVAALVAASTGADLASSADLLGLAVGVLGERRADEQQGVTTTRAAAADAAPTQTEPAHPIRVLDLSALWAGPLCASLLGEAGAEVIKVESVERPDAARRGDPELFSRLNAAKAHEWVDLRSPAGRRRLRELVSTADVVVESSRPRALEQVGILAAEMLALPGGPTVWVSITGHGRASNRIAFGDDAAVAGGLVGADDDGPTFLGDAVADPLSGVVAAAAAAEALAAGERGLVDVAMSGVAAAVVAAAA